MSNINHKNNYLKFLVSTSEVVKVFLVKKYHVDYVIVTAAASKLLIFQIPIREFKFSHNNQVNYHIQELFCKKEITHVSEAGGKLFAVDITGDIFYLELSASKSDDIEGDIFSSEDEADLKWVLSKNKTSFSCESFLAGCSSDLGMCVLVNDSGSTKVNLEMKNDARSVEISKQSSKAGCLLTVDNSKLGIDFMKKWFPGNDPSLSGQHLFVALSDGSLYSLRLLPSVGAPVLLFKSIHSIVSLNWFQDESSLKFDGLLILLSSGGLVKLSPFGEDTMFPFPPYIEHGCILDKYILCSNEYETHVCSHESYEKKITIPSLGTVSCAPVAENCDLTVVSSSNKELILIKLSSLEPPAQELASDFPILEDLEVLITKANYFNKLTEKVNYQDNYLKAKSLSLRGDVLKEHFSSSLHVIQVFSPLHTLRVKICFNIPGIVFSKDHWKLTIDLETYEKKVTKDFCLSDNLSSSRPVVKLINMPFDFDLLFKVGMSLTFFGSSEIIIPVAKVEMDSSYFILPLSLKDLYETLPDRGFQYECMETFIDIPISGNSTPEEIFRKLLRNSKAMWRTQEWKEILGSSDAMFILFGYPAEIKVANDCLKISCRNVKVCLALKISIFLCMHKMDESILKDRLLLDITAWYQAEEILVLGENSKELFHEITNMIKDCSRYSL